MWVLGMAKTGWPGKVTCLWALPGLFAGLWGSEGSRPGATQATGRRDLGGSSVHGSPSGTGGRALNIGCWGQGVCRGEVIVALTSIHRREGTFCLSPASLLTSHRGLEQPSPECGYLGIAVVHLRAWMCPHGRVHIHVRLCVCLRLILFVYSWGLACLPAWACVCPHLCASDSVGIFLKGSPCLPALARVRACMPVCADLCVPACALSVLLFLFVHLESVPLSSGTLMCD